MRVLLFPHGHDELRLRRRAEELPGAAFGTPQIRQLGELLHELLEPIENVIMLAATQVDFPGSVAWKILAVRMPSGIALLLNPKIRDFGGQHVGPETCASFLAVPETIDAPERCVVQYKRLDGKNEESEVKGSAARAAWQGCASLDGRLFVDRMVEIQKTMFLRRVRRQYMQRLGGLS